MALRTDDNGSDTTSASPDGLHLSDLRPLILMYHSISKRLENPNDIWTSPKNFTDQMNVLKAQGLRGVSMRDFRRAHGRGEARGMVVLTFDDGYVDFLDTATPVMEKFGFTGTVFAVAGLLGRENDWAHHFYPRPKMELLDADGLREAEARGMEVAAHTVTHPSLAKLAPEEVRREVTEGRVILSEALGREVGGFCYPYGITDAESVEAVREAGYIYACAITQRPERADHDLPRVGVCDRDRPVRFFAKISYYRSALGRRKLY